MDPSKIDNLISYLEEAGVSQDEIEAMVETVKKRNGPEEEKVEENDDEIRIKIMEEPDWRKRAALAALLISKSL